MSILDYPFIYATKAKVKSGEHIGKPIYDTQISSDVSHNFAKWSKCTPHHGSLEKIIWLSYVVSFVALGRRCIELRNRHKKKDASSFFSDEEWIDQGEAVTSLALYAAAFFKDDDVFESHSVTRSYCADVLRAIESKSVAGKIPPQYNPNYKYERGNSTFHSPDNSPSESEDLEVVSSKFVKGSSVKAAKGGSSRVVKGTSSRVGRVNASKAVKGVASKRVRNVPLKGAKGTAPEVDFDYTQFDTSSVISKTKFSTNECYEEWVPALDAGLFLTQCEGFEAKFMIRRIEVPTSGELSYRNHCHLNVYFTILMFRVIVLFLSSSCIRNFIFEKGTSYA